MVADQTKNNLYTLCAMWGTLIFIVPLFEFSNSWNVVNSLMEPRLLVTIKGFAPFDTGGGKYWL